MSDSLDLEAAVLEARAARARLIETAHEIQARLAPARLVDDAVETVRSSASDLAQTTADVARRRPGVATAAAVSGAVLLLHRPVLRLIRGRRRHRHRSD